MAQRIIKAIFYRPGPPGPPGNLPGLYYTAEEIDEFLGDYALTTALDALLPITDVLNEPDMATGATDKPPSQASVAEYVTDGLATKVSLTGDESIDGVKTFTSSPVVPDPTTAQQATSKAYVDAGLALKLDDTLSPILLMSPDVTRNRVGAITPTTTGAPSVVAGEYGDAWYFAAAADTVRIANAVDHIPTDTATILVRATFEESASNRYPLSASLTQLAIGRSTSGQMSSHLGGQPLTSSIANVSIGELHTLALRYSPDGRTMFVDGEVVGSGTYTAPSLGTPSLILSDPTLTSNNHSYAIEGVLVFDHALPDSEIARLSQLPEQWTWQSARLRTPEAVAIADHLADTGNPHEVTAEQIDLGNVDNTADLDKPISTATQAALNVKANRSELNAHMLDQANPHKTTKAQVGLGNVDNTSDLDKPISTATQAVLDEHGAIIVPAAHRMEGDILWVGPAGPQWHQFEDVLNGVNTTERYGYGLYGDGDYPE